MPATRSGIEFSPERVRTALGRLRDDVATGWRHIVRDLRASSHAIQRDLRSLGRGLTPHRTTHTPHH